MPQPINIGADFGSLGWRAVYVSPSNELTPVPLPQLWNSPERWLICEANPASPLGVGFASIKSQVGMQIAEDGSGESQAVATVRGFLGDLRREIETRMQCAGGQIVVAVPALYSASRRTALHEAALAAGFTGVHLLNDGMAAAIARARTTADGRTILVYSMGYAGYEVALIRVAKGRFRAVSYEGSATPGGATFDHIILNSLARVHPALSLRPSKAPRTAEFALAWRDTVQQFKETLSTDESAALSLSDDVSDGRFLVVSRRNFEGAIESMISASLQAAKRAVEEANLTLSDIDDVLLTGGSTNLQLVQRLAARMFSRPPVFAGVGLLAEGAAIYAARLEGHVTAEAPRITRSEGSASTDVVPQLQVDFAPAGWNSSGLPVRVFFGPGLQSFPTVLDPGDRFACALAAGRRSLDCARDLIADGEREQAADLLKQLTVEAQALLDKLAAPAGSGMRREPERLLQRARELLANGRFEQAIENTHRAYVVDQSPAVFQHMIEIHCLAAMTLTADDDYANAIRWLMCARTHDPTNHDVHLAIAQRHYLHARSLKEGGDTEGALASLEDCLCFDPDHAEALGLRAEINELRPRTMSNEGSGAGNV